MIKLAALLLGILLLPISAHASYPDPVDRYLNDFTGTLSADSQQSIKRRLSEIHAKNRLDIRVAIINKYASFKTKNKTWESFSTELFNHWQIGDRFQNRGVLLLISLDDRKIRIELGSGYSSKFDKGMKSIIDSVISPPLTKSKFSEGISNGIEAILNSVTVEQSFLDRYFWHILIGCISLASCFFAFLCFKMENPPILFVILGIVGFVLYGLVLASAEQNSYGGGSSGGGGASGSF